MSQPSPDRLPEPTAEEVFVLLWESMADLLGTVATATLVRRALQRAKAQQPALAGVTAGRDGLTYCYSVPETWRQPLDQEALAALHVLTRELYPLLVEMTGPVVVRRLARVEGLRQLALAPGDEERL